MEKRFPKQSLHLSVKPARSAVPGQPVCDCLPLLAGRSMPLVQGEAISSEALCKRSDWRSLFSSRWVPTGSRSNFPLADQPCAPPCRLDGQGLTERVRLTPMGP